MSDPGFRWLLISLSLLQTALLATLLIRSQSHSDSRSATEQTLLGTSPSDHAAMADAAIKPQMLQQLIRNSLRSELAAVLAAQQNTKTSTANAYDKVPALAAEARREQETQFANSDAVVSAALATGIWTERDSLALIPHLSSLSQAQRTQLLEKFHGAVNRQELKLEDIPPL